MGCCYGSAVPRPAVADRKVVNALDELAKEFVIERVAMKNARQHVCARQDVFVVETPGGGGYGVSPPECSEKLC